MENTNKSLIYAVLVLICAIVVTSLLVFMKRNEKQSGLEDSNSEFQDVNNAQKEVKDVDNIEKIEDTAENEVQNKEVSDEYSM